MNCSPLILTQPLTINQPELRVTLTDKSEKYKVLLT